MIRATLRNPGWSKIWCSLYQLGIVNEIEFASAPPTYRRLFDFLTDFHYGTVSEEELIQALKKDYPLEAVEAISWLGLLDDKEIPYEFTNSVDILAALMSEKMVYKKNERDMVLLYHIIKAVSPEGREEKYVSQLTAFGTPDGETAMAKTVSLPSAIAVELIMDKEITSPGVHIPVEPEIYEPVLKGLKAIGIEVKETRME
jgi:saccharopine dehydrogenase-like NADP-dependent oxidoreductase